MNATFVCRRLNAAPKARNMIARGKRKGRVAPGTQINPIPALKGRNMLQIFRPFRPDRTYCVNQGRRASRLPLAFILRAFGATSDF